MIRTIRSHFHTLLISSFLTVYLLITLPALIQPNHSLYNLEPYPDGLLYALSARNFAISTEFALTYNGTSLPLWVPPLYAASLIPGYIIIQAPQVFYLSNVLFGAAALFFLLLTISRTTKSWQALVVGGALYLAHGYTLWLPTVPMAENLSLLLFSVGIATLYLPKKFQFLHFVIVSLLAIGLVFTKYASVFIAMALLGAAIYRIRHYLNKKQILAIATLGLILVVAYWLTVQNPFSLVAGAFRSIFSADNQFFGLRFLLPNGLQYFKSLSFSGYFLWLSTPLSSIITFLGFIIALFWLATRKNGNRWQPISLLVIFLAQFPLQLVFYTVDTRYVIFSIPIFVLGISWAVAELTKHYSLKYIIAVALFFLAGHAYFQLPLYKEVIAANVLGKSSAWQYQAIQHFDRTFTFAESLDDVYLITALPPHLVDAYQLSAYKVLPLSQHQEFLQKGEHVWGEDVPYDNLIAGYKQWLTDEKELYISNAYITHQQSVISDYETYKEYFQFKLVKEGCMGACNVYQLLLPEESAEITKSQ